MAWFLYIFSKRMIHGLIFYFKPVNYFLKILKLFSCYALEIWNEFSVLNRFCLHNQHDDDKVNEKKYLLNLKSRRECLKKTLQRGIISCLKKTKLTKIGPRYELGTANIAFTSLTAFNAYTASTFYSVPKPNLLQGIFFVTWLDPIRFRKS